MSEANDPLLVLIMTLHRGSYGCLKKSIKQFEFDLSSTLQAFSNSNSAGDVRGKKKAPAAVRIILTLNFK